MFFPFSIVMLTSQQTFVLMKTSFVLSSKYVFMTSSRRLDENKYILINHTCSEDVFKTSSRRLAQDQYIRLVHTSSRRLQDIFKTSCQDVFKTSSRRLANRSWRHLQDILKTYHQVKLFLLTSVWEVFNMFVRRTAKTVVYRKIHLGYTSEKFMVSVQNLLGW